MNKQEDMGNNETRYYGIYKGNEGYLAMTRAKSKWFKTEKGAIRWLCRTAPNIAKELGLRK